MKILSPLNKQIEALMALSNEEYGKKNYERSIKLLEEAWNLLPEPKGIYDESFHIVLYISETYLLIKKPHKAKNWSEKIFDCSLERIDSGQRDFLAGKVAYELNDLDNAKKYFTIANKKSRGRCFKAGDEKYLKFFRSK